MRNLLIISVLLLFIVSCADKKDSLTKETVPIFVPEEIDSGAAFEEEPISISSSEAESIDPIDDSSPTEPPDFGQWSWLEQMRYFVESGEIKGQYKISPEEAKKIIENKANIIINALEEKDMNTLFQYVHEEWGLIILPHGSYEEWGSIIQPQGEPIENNEKRYKRDELDRLLEDPTIFYVGSVPFTSYEIQLTFREFYNNFIYDMVYASSDLITYNQSIGEDYFPDDNSFPNPIVVEFIVDAVFGAIRTLVFKEYVGEWYLYSICGPGEIHFF